MKYKKDKDDYVYSLKYDEQTLYYFDDSLFEGQEPSSLFNVEEVCKISEINEYIEEFSKYFDSGYYVYDGLLKLQYKRESCQLKDLPIIKNNKNEAAKLNTKFIKNETVSGEIFYDCEIYLILDLTKTFSEILYDLEILDAENEFFNISTFYEEVGISSDNNFKEYISAERIFMLDKDEYCFIMMEYCQLRKYMGFSEESAQTCLKKIYDFEKES